MADKIQMLGDYLFRDTGTLLKIEYPIGTVVFIFNKSTGALTIGTTDTSFTGAKNIISAINYLQGLNVGSISSGAHTANITGGLGILGTASYLQLPVLTTAQRDALTPTAGMLIYNSTTAKLNVYTTAWEAVTSA